MTLTFYGFSSKKNRGHDGRSGQATFDGDHPVAARLAETRGFAPRRRSLRHRNPMHIDATVFKMSNDL
jgi:hypothetical protein